MNPNFEPAFLMCEWLDERQLSAFVDIPAAREAFVAWAEQRNPAVWQTLLGYHGDANGIVTQAITEDKVPVPVIEF